MTAQDVERYLEGAPEPHGTTLRSMWDTLVRMLPEGEPGIAYGVPVLKVDGKGVAGVGYSAKHCTYFPMSGTVTAALADELTGYATAKGSIRFAPDEPLPDDLLRRLVDARLAEIARPA